MSNDNQQIIHEGTRHTNFVMIPRVAYKLEPYAFKLLGVYLDFNVTYISNANMALLIGCSVNRMKKARQVLQDAGYIKTQSRADAPTRVTVNLNKLWSENAPYTRMMMVIGEEDASATTLSQNDTPLSNGDTPLSQNDTELYLLSHTKEEIKDFASTSDAPQTDEKPTIPKAKAPTKTKEQSDALFEVIVDEMYAGVERAKVNTYGSVIAKSYNNLWARADAHGQVLTPELLRTYIHWYKKTAKENNWNATRIGAHNLIAKEHFEGFLAQLRPRTPAQVVRVAPVQDEHAPTF